MKMKMFLTLCIALFTSGCLLQAQVTENGQHSKNEGRVSFVTTIDTSLLTKDGIYLNGYVINISYEKAKSLQGKTVRIKGRVTIFNGTASYTDGEIRQGRLNDTKYINSPRIKIIDS